MNELFSLTLRALSDPPSWLRRRQPDVETAWPPAEVRFRQALEVLLRRFGFQCLFYRKEAPDLYAGWYQLVGKPWQRTCAAACPQVCWQMLEERALDLPPFLRLAVLPRGVLPEKEIAA